MFVMFIIGVMFVMFVISVMFIMFVMFVIFVLFVANPVRLTVGQRLLWCRYCGGGDNDATSRSVALDCRK